MDRHSGDSLGLLSAGKEEVEDVGSDRGGNGEEGGMRRREKVRPRG